MPEKLALALDQFAGSGSRLDGNAHKALADALKRLERNGLMTRTALPTALIGVEHAITPLGH
jgi:DNA-binding HxlR family transcriptional regulator